MDGGCWDTMRERNPRGVDKWGFLGQLEFTCVTFPIEVKDMIIEELKHDLG